MRITFRWLAAAAVAVVTLASAHAQGYPNRAVRIIVPYPAGGTTDIIARIAAQQLSERLKQTFIVENKAGANGAIGTVQVARAPADGYTLLIGAAATHGINSALYKDLPYDPVQDFAPITIIASTPEIITINPSVPAKNLRELLALAKESPGKLNYGSTSPGGVPHMSAELLKLAVGVNMVHVPYKGAAPMLTDLIGGQIQVGFDNFPSSIGHVHAGRIRALAVTTLRRWPGAPEIPTVAESGVAGYEVSSWFGLFAPSGTGPAVIETIQQAIADAMKQPEVRKQLLDLGAEPIANTPGAFAAIVHADVTKWATLAKNANIKID
jgi:tripartite-type tricarboxylate transporter receptor subunit TctC